jgi:phosphoglycolate phosphatase
MFKHVLCDFDGTLVDSADGILVTIRKCIERAGLAVVVEPSRDLIGPPLRRMISAVIGSEHAAMADIEKDFRTEYDERGYLLTVSYPGIPQALKDLHKGGVTLHLVTNKRLIPVRQILEQFGWNHYFQSVNTLDSTAGASSKSDVVALLLARLDVSLDTVMIVGDTLDDWLAAQANGISFAWASWGYGRDPTLKICGQPLTGSGDFVQHVLR